MSNEHAVFSPSRLERILACPGSVKLIQALIQNNRIPAKQVPSSYAQRGTKLHKLVHEVNFHGKSILKDLDPEDTSQVLDCLEYIDMLLKSIGHSHFTIASELRVNLAEWGLPDIWGTADKVIKDNASLTVHVIDWKFGSGVLVNAEENPQLMAYAAGAIGWPTPYKKVTMHVFQPALDHESLWSIPVNDLYAWVHGVLAVGIGECQKDDPSIIPGETQCRWCEAANHCDMRFTYIQNVAQDIFQAQKLLPKDITPEAIADLIASAPLIEQAIKDLKLFVQNEILRGRPVPGLKLVSGRSNRKWKDEKQATQWLANNTKIEELFKSKLISPSQAEKLYSALKRNEEFQSLWDKAEGKPTLVSEKDPRPAIPTTSSAIDVFKDYTNGPSKLE